MTGRTEVTSTEKVATSPSSTLTWAGLVLRMNAVTTMVSSTEAEPSAFVA